VFSCGSPLVLHRPSIGRCFAVQLMQRVWGRFRPTEGLLREVYYCLRERAPETGMETRRTLCARFHPDSRCAPTGGGAAPTGQRWARRCSLACPLAGAKRGWEGVKEGGELCGDKVVEQPTAQCGPRYRRSEAITLRIGIRTCLNRFPGILWDRRLGHIRPGVLPAREYRRRQANSYSGSSGSTSEVVPPSPCLSKSS